MKTLKTLFTSALTAIILSATVFASTAAASPVIAIHTSNLDIKKIKVTGNVKVFVVQGSSDWVSMDEENLPKVSLKQIGNTLTISSSESNPISVTVYVKDIYRIEASDKAVVRTVGKFNVKYLQVLLRDNAIARVKASTQSIYTVISDQANLELLGTTDKHIVKKNGIGNINTEKFAALTTHHEAVDVETAMNIEKASPKK